MQREGEIVDSNTLVFDFEDLWPSGQVNISNDDAALQGQEDLGGEFQHAIGVRTIDAESAFGLVRAMVQVAAHRCDYGLLRLGKSLLPLTVPFAKDAVDECLIVIETDRGGAVADRRPQRAIRGGTGKRALQLDLEWGFGRATDNVKGSTGAGNFLCLSQTLP